MTKGLENALGLPSLADLLDEQGLLDDETPDAHAVDEQFLGAVEALNQNITAMGGKDHGEAMDTIYTETLRHARDIADLGFNADHARAAGILAVSATMFKVALDAKKEKRTQQLNTIKAAQEQQKIDIALRQTPSLVAQSPVKSEESVQGLRNDIIAQFSKSKKN